MLVNDVANCRSASRRLSSARFSAVIRVAVETCSVATRRIDDNASGATVDNAFYIARRRDHRVSRRRRARHRWRRHLLPISCRR